MSQIASSMALQRQLARSGTQFAKAPVSRVQSRNLQDIAITRTGKPIIRISGGRYDSSSPHILSWRFVLAELNTLNELPRLTPRKVIPLPSSEPLVSSVATLSTDSLLARAGCTVVVPFREEMAKRHLKVSGDLGRVVFLEGDLRNTASIEEAVRHSDIVYNLIGRDYPTKNFDLEDVHVEGATRIADAVAKYDVDRFVHVSSHSVSKDSPSEFYRTKARGEEAVRSIFPETTIVRPAPLFGFEDRLLHRLAKSSNLLTSNNLEERFWPVHAIDVGEALEKMCHDDSTAGETYELYGPKQYQMAEIKELVEREILKSRRHINIPRQIMTPIAQLMNKLVWFSTMSKDSVAREFIDQTIDPNAKTFKDLGIEPTDLANFTYHYLQAYRSSSYYDLPPMTEREKREEKKYLHVLDDQ
ncbi:hypothetical protein E4T43_02849 [Aureobasidium subglaciale]|nr:hypothetical protein E4T43_02849 [Aureobasidium subglaciale]